MQKSELNGHEKLWDVSLTVGRTKREAREKVFPSLPFVARRARRKNSKAQHNFSQAKREWRNKNNINFEVKNNQQKKFLSMFTFNGSHGRAFGLHWDLGCPFLVCWKGPREKK